MTDRERLLRRVCLDPADDLPRLLYADWCDETGRHDRAEFIRCQIEKVQVYRDRPKGIFSPYVDTHSWKIRFAELRARERELQAPGVDWWDDYGGPNVHVLEWRRGFAEHIAVSCKFWLAHGPAIVRQQPITRVVLSDREPSSTYAGGRHIWYLGPMNDGPDHIPLHWLGKPMQFAFATPQAAKDVLSAKALLWARTEAGLEVAS